eukprot:931959-Pleurochrysis_carterae.AAC.1
MVSAGEAFGSEGSRHPPRGASHILLQPNVCHGGAESWKLQPPAQPFPPPSPAPQPPQQEVTPPGAVSPMQTDYELPQTSVAEAAELVPAVPAVHGAGSAGADWRGRKNTTGTRITIPMLEGHLQRALEEIELLKTYIELQ